MRRTLVLDADVYEVAGACARLHKVSPGKAVPEMTRRAPDSVRIEEDPRGFPVLRATAGSPVVTTGRTGDSSEQMDADEAARTPGR